jgi:hypothetical protein
MMFVHFEDDKNEIENTESTIESKMIDSTARCIFYFRRPLFEKRKSKQVMRPRLDKDMGQRNKTEQLRKEP